VQVILGDLVTAADAFCHVAAGELDMDAARMGADAPAEVDVRAAGRAGALADPQEVGGCVVPPPGVGIGSGEGLLVVEEQGFVAGLELHRAQLGRIGAAGAHERQGVVYLVGEPFVVLPRGALPDEVLVPAVGLVEVRVASGGEGTAQVERGR
jgi:hypothetical protein